MAALKFKEIGNARYKEGKYADAIEAYGSAIDEDPTNCTYYSNRAAAYLMLKKYDEALNDCKKISELDPSFTKAYTRASKCYSQRGMIVEAKAVLNDRLKEDESNEEILKELEVLKQVENDLYLAQEHLNKDDYDRASYYVERVQSHCTDSSHVLRMRADLLIGRKKFEDAASICWALLAKNRLDPDLLFLRGKALMYSGSTDQAMKHLEEALRVDPDHSRAKQLRKSFKEMEKLKNSGNDFFKEGKCNEAIKLYTEAMELDPKNTNYNSTLLCNRAAAKMRQRKFKEALEDCNEALQLNETYVKAVTRKAECLLQMEEYEDAVREWEKATNMDSESREYKAKLREAKLELKKSKRKNYYKILEVTKEADESEIKRAYKKMALKFHPDKWNNATDEEKEDAEKQFKEIGEAYSVLTDPQKRRRYDAGQVCNGVVTTPGLTPIA